MIGDCVWDSDGSSKQLQPLDTSYDHSKLAAALSGKATLRCVTCYKSAELWCTHCIQAYCVVCWNKVAQHPLYDLATMPGANLVNRANGRQDMRVIGNTTEESSAQKSYSSAVLFSTYPITSQPSDPAPVPYEFEIMPSRQVSNDVYMGTDGSVQIVRHDLEYYPDSRPDSRARTPMRLSARQRPKSHSQSYKQANFATEIKSVVHYNFPITSRFGSAQGTRPVVRKSNNIDRPLSPAFSANPGGGLSMAYSKKPSSASAPIVGIAQNFQPADWRDGLFQAKDPLGIANKHARLERGGDTKMIAGFTVHTKIR